MASGAGRSPAAKAGAAVTQIQHRQPTDLAPWRVIDEPAQPQPIYHVHLSGAPAWLAAIGQMPTAHLMTIAAVVGSLGGVVLVAFMATLATLATVAGIAIVGIVFVAIASLVLAAMVRG